MWRDPAVANGSPVQAFLPPLSFVKFTTGHPIESKHYIELLDEEPCPSIELRYGPNLSSAYTYKHKYLVIEFK